MSLTAEELRAGYGNNATGALVLDGVSVSVERGSLVALLGPNGSGKSTLTRCLARALRPHTGRLIVDGDDLWSLSARDAARRIAYVGQDNPMPFAFTVSELVRLGAEAAAKNAPGTAIRRANAAMEAMEVAHLAGRSVVALSGGERQRAAIARALAQDADYLLLDEPTAHLDLRHQAALMHAAAKAKAGGKGVLIVLHDPALAVAHADRVLLMDAGKIAASGSPAEALTEANLRAVYRTPIRVVSGAPLGEGAPSLLLFPVEPLHFSSTPPLPPAEQERLGEGAGG